MKLFNSLSLLFSIVSFSSLTFAAESSTHANKTMVPGKDYALFDTGAKLVQGKERGPVIWYLSYLFWKDKAGHKCKFGKNNCCYGKDNNGCCLGQGGSGKCPPCPGPYCPFPCGIENPSCSRPICPGPNCPNLICPGPDCPYPCPGPFCPYVCPGPNCPNLCPGPNCPIVCPGPNCPTQCPGPYCPVPCPPQGCGNIICPPQVCNFEFNGRPIIFNIVFNQNIFIVNNPSWVCIRVNGANGPLRICGPPDNLYCKDLKNGQMQVKINNPADDRLEISPAREPRN